MTKINEVNLSYEYINECLRYENGKLYWKERPEYHFKSKRYHSQFNKIRKDKEAGNYDTKYIRIRINYQKIAAHRIIWFIHHRKWPEKFIDHINGDMKDNRIENLRLSDENGNSQNCKLNARNKFGVKGIRKSGNKWRVQITNKREVIYLGTFDTLDEAIKIRISAEFKYFGEFRRKYNFEE